MSGELASNGEVERHGAGRRRRMPGPRLAEVAGSRQERYASGSVLEQRSAAEQSRPPTVRHRIELWMRAELPPCAAWLGCGTLAHRAVTGSGHVGLEGAHDEVGVGFEDDGGLAQCVVLGAAAGWRRLARRR